MTFGKGDFWEGSYGTLAWMLLMPTITMMLGSLSIFKFNPGHKMFSAMQHLASGLLLGAVVWEVGPHMEAHSETEKEALLVGFLIGFGLLMFMARFKPPKISCCKGLQNSEDIPFHSDDSYSEKEDSHYTLDIEDPTPKAQGGWPVGLVAAVWMNGAIDGLLIGIAYIGGGASGLITSIALAIEQGLLGVTTSRSILKTCSPKKTILISLPLALPIPVAGMIAGTLLANVSGEAYIGINAFGMAGLIYLVTEELLVEAHEDHSTDRWYVTINVFLGFMFVIALDNFVPSNL